MGVIILCLHDGMFTLYDSNLYLAACHHLQTQGFTDLFALGAFKAKPPLFTFFLYSINANTLILSIVHTLCLLGSVSAAFYLIEQLISERDVRILTKILVALGTPWILVHHMLLPEPLFILCWNFYLVFIYKAHRKKSQKWFFGAIITGVLMIGLRHIGIFLVVLPGAWLYSQVRHTAQSKLALVSAVVPILLFGVWQVLLYAHVHHFGRLDHISGVKIFDNAQQVIYGIARWFAPLYSDHLTNITAFTSVTILCAGVGFSLKNSLHTAFNRLLAFQTLIFIVLITLKGDLIFSDIERYLSLIYLPLLLVFCSGIKPLTRALSCPSYIATILAYVWLIYPMVRLAHNVAFWSGL